jgi:hypothetical protein
LVSWRCFQQKLIGVGEDGIPKKRIKKCFKETSTFTFIDYLRSNLQRFVTNNFIAMWEDVQFRLSMDSLPTNTILSPIDFGDNYSFEMQNEI